MPTSRSGSSSFSRAVPGTTGRPPCAASHAEVRGLGGVGRVDDLGRLLSFFWSESCGASPSLSRSRPPSAPAIWIQTSVLSTPVTFMFWTRSQSWPSIGRHTPKIFAPFLWKPVVAALAEAFSLTTTLSASTFHSPNFLFSSEAPASPTRLRSTPSFRLGITVASISMKTLSPGPISRGGMWATAAGMVCGESRTQASSPTLKGLPMTHAPFFRVPRIMPFVVGWPRSVTKVCTTS
mmetsp:Transcript_90785/g.252553  ORF Transcript_90785/g.252553 Transcript_90785/m.252553 type:complete len:236 (+) Transcript_90785:1131-1838(+)